MAKDSKRQNAGGGSRQNATSIPSWLKSMVPGASSAEKVKQKSPKELDKLRKEGSLGKRKAKGY